MRRIGLLTFLLIAITGLPAQVLAPAEVRESSLRPLQQQYWSQLRAMSDQIAGHKFPYPFYFSRTLDVDEARQLQMDQRSVEFARHDGQTVLQITGNYYASYSGETMDRNRRARQTFDDVVLPLLQAAVPYFEKEAPPDAFALEISHHVRQKVLGVSTENPENVTVIVPHDVARRLVAARNPAERQAALLDSQVFLNAEPLHLWVRNDVEAPADGPMARPIARSDPGPAAPSSSSKTSTVFTAPTSTSAASIRDLSPTALHALQSAHQDVLDQLVRELDKQAHFVPYAPPTLIAFHGAAYLQLSVNTTLRTQSGSRYKLAALAFDEHIAHLLRPALAFLKGDDLAGGIVFSTSIHLAGSDADPASSEAVEFFFPLPALRCYERLDCTGQQVINSGFVLINGERVGLELQSAEAVSR